MQKGAIFGSAFGANQQISLSRLKSGEDVRLFVKSGELLTLFEELSVLYALHAQHGTQPGKSTFTKADPQLTQLAKLSTVDLNAILEANSALGGDLLTKLLTWATAEEDLPKLVHRLLELSPNSLRILNYFGQLATAKVSAASIVWTPYLQTRTSCETGSNR